ncbi:MAG: carboxypeptidase-like regulatory domain-containing protein [Chitinophagales bacterium]|nr:carboxypeptidase-like regulatory domain-containing protein [Chitinophagales bacterium]
MKSVLLIVATLLLGVTGVKAQPFVYPKRMVVQFSGMIKDNISNAPIPFAIVYVDKEKRGTVSTIDGFYSFAVAQGDVVLFKSIGYKPYKLEVPKEMMGDSYFKDIYMERETYALDTITIYPLPRPHQLRQAIANLDIPDDMVALAKKTIEKSKLDELTKATRYDGNENFNQYLKNQVQSYYHYGQPAPIRLFDAFSWAEFIKSLKKKNKSIGTDKNGESVFPEF